MTTLIYMLNILFAVSMPVTHIVGYAVGLVALALSWKFRRQLVREPLVICLLLLLAYGALRTPFLNSAGGRRWSHVWLFQPLVTAAASGLPFSPYISRKNSSPCCAFLDFIYGFVCCFVCFLRGADAASF